jgi:homoserine kinase type II
MDPTGCNDLIALLARYPAIARPYQPPEVLGDAGGLSGARLWRYESGQGRLLARAWPPDGPGRAGLEQIHRWLEQAGRVGFVPVPLRALDGRTLHEQGGRLWEVVPWLDGAAVSEWPPKRPRLHSGFAALAAFHQALDRDCAQGSSPGLRARLGEIDSLIRHGFDDFQHALVQAPADPRCEAAQQWLALARATAPRLVAPLKRAVAQELPLQPCLRDVRPEHLLFSDDRVTGLVDFGAMAIDSVAADLARLLSEWVGPDRAARAEGLAAYAAIRPLDPIEITLIDLFEESAALLGAGHWIRWHFLEARVFNNVTAVATGIARGLRRLAERTCSETVPPVGSGSTGLCRGPALLFRSPGSVESLAQGRIDLDQHR